MTIYHVILSTEALDYLSTDLSTKLCLDLIEQVTNYFVANAVRIDRWREAIFREAQTLLMSHAKQLGEISLHEALNAASLNPCNNHSIGIRSLHITMFSVENDGSRYTHHFDTNNVVQCCPFVLIDMVRNVFTCYINGIMTKYLQNASNHLPS